MRLNGNYNKHVLVTGGAGYLGSSLVPLLLADNYQVTVYDSFNYGIFSLLSSIGCKNLKLIKGDIRDRDHLKKVLNDDVDIVVHLAAIVGYPACDRDRNLAIEVNEYGTKNVVDLLNDKQKIIFSSTGSCYGAVDGICTEGTPISPLTLYGETKANAEKIVLNANGVVLRFATLYGVSTRIRLDLLINDMTRHLLKEKKVCVYEPNFRRTFLHVKDAARSLLFSIENYDSMSTNIFNVGDESLNMTKIEAIQRICNFIPGSCVTISDDGHDLDKRDYDVSYSKISKLGFKASSILFDDGIKELVQVMPLINSNELDLYRNA